jgi:hypothetical protein
MLDERSRYFAEVADCILSSGSGVYKATKYISDKLTIKATRKRYKGKFLHNKVVDLVFTMGIPNYEERQFIKLCKKAGESFPVKKIQLKFARNSQ